MNLPALKRLIPLFLFSSVVVTAADVAKVTPQEAAARVAANRAVLVDVREPEEWAETGVATPAALLPKSDFDGAQALWKEFLAKNRGKEVILYCHSGRRAGKVAAALAAQGFQVANAGGFADWESAGLPTRKVAPAKP